MAVFLIFLFKSATHRKLSNRFSNFGGDGIILLDKVFSSRHNINKKSPQISSCGLYKEDSQFESELN